MNKNQQIIIERESEEEQRERERVKTDKKSSGCGFC